MRGGVFYGQRLLMANNDIVRKQEQKIVGKMVTMPLFLISTGCHEVLQTYEYYVYTVATPVLRSSDES